MRKESRAILVEGYMDVIGVSAATIHNVVASCGTALTSAQVRAMKRHSENIVVNFDPDIAGANATQRSLQMLLDEGMHVRILELEPGLDPDEFIKTRGSGEYAQRLDHAAGYFIWLADRARKKFGSASAEARIKGYEELLLPAIRRISDRLERAAVATEVAEYLGLDRNLVLAEFRRIPGVQPARRVAQPAGEIPVRERVLLRSIVLSQEVRDLLVPALRDSAAAKSYRLWSALETICALYENNQAFTWEDLVNIAGDDQKNLLSTVLLADKSAEVFTPEQARGFINLLESEDRGLRYKEIQRSLQQAVLSGNQELAIALTREYDELRKRNSRLSPG
jgi:DNA primase